MKVAADQKCFICGPDNPIGLKAEFDINEQAQKAQTNLSLSDHYQGWQGVVHGGIISALLDEAAIYACRPVSLHGVTAGLSVRFRKPAFVGSDLHIEAEIVSIRKRFAEVKSRLTCQGDLLAEADVKVKLLDEAREKIDE